MTPKDKQNKTEPVVLTGDYQVKLPADFSAKLNLKLKKEMENQKKSVWPYMGWAVAALLALSFIPLNFQKTSEDRPTVKESRQITAATKTAFPLKKAIPVEIDFKTHKALENAEFSIELPEGIRFVSSDQEVSESDRISWIDNLKKGSNVIPFLIEGNVKGKFKIKAQIRKDDFLAVSSLEFEFNSGI